MENTIISTRIKQNTSQKAGIYNPKYVGWMCVLFFVLILGRAFNNIFFYAFAGVSFVVFVISKTKYCIPMLLFLLPFSTILKPNVDAISFFTILFFVVIAKMIISNPRLDSILLMCLLCFFTYNILFSGFGQLTTIITMVAGILMLYYVRIDDIDADLSVLTFSIGICLSSILALFKTSLPIVNAFISDIALKLGENNYIVRFSGVQGNPNYYTLDIIIALSAIIVLMYEKEKSKKIYTVLMIFLSILGLMSISKSFLVSWILLIFIWLMISLKQGASKFVKFVFIAIIGAAVAYFVAYDYINSYLLRFAQDSSGSLGEITTGRSDIWMDYIKAIFNNIKILFFGNGLNTLYGNRGTHNTYIESLFSLGIIGSILLFVSIKRSIGKKIGSKILLLPIFMLMVRMFAIGILTYDNLWFYLLLLVLLSKEYSRVLHKNMQ